MFELMGLLLLAGVAGVVLLGFLCVLWVIKLAFKIALIPLALFGGLLKLVLGVVAVVLLLTLGLPVLAFLLLLAPLLLLGLLFWGGVCALGAFA